MQVPLFLAQLTDHAILSLDFLHCRGEQSADIRFEDALLRHRRIPLFTIALAVNAWRHCLTAWVRTSDMADAARAFNFAFSA